ncbi:MAG TPA: bifunctional enoyl-CoA hydratase/phosphate acetyltransferase, partial [Candidatus Acidoferrum sp.]
ARKDGPHRTKHEADRKARSSGATVMTKTTELTTGRPQHAYDDLLERCRALEPIVTSVVFPCESTALTGAVEAADAGLITPILVGPREKIVQVAKEARLDISAFEIEDVPDPSSAAAKAVELVRIGRAEVLMKGSLHTDELMSAVVSAAARLRTSRRISHAFVMAVPSYPKPLIITDAVVNIAPSLDDKRDICQNAIDLAHSLGCISPKVAILSAVEEVNTKIPSTVDAAALCKMADRGQITGGILDGPLAMDNAISAEAAKTKGLVSLVAGDADILVVPDLEAGNILAKQFIFLANADAAGVVLGARVPIILTSRADSVRTRMASCGLALLLAHALRNGNLQPNI